MKNLFTKIQNSIDSLIGLDSLNKNLAEFEKNSSLYIRELEQTNINLKGYILELDNANSQMELIINKN